MALFPLPFAGFVGVLSRFSFDLVFIPFPLQGNERLNKLVRKGFYINKSEIIIMKRNCIKRISLYGKGCAYNIENNVRK